jgi:hypothetical protein
MGRVLCQWQIAAVTVFKGAQVARSRHAGHAMQCSWFNLNVYFQLLLQGRSYYAVFWF